jgi:hypothetical protein
MSAAPATNSVPVAPTPTEESAAVLLPNEGFVCTTVPSCMQWPGGCCGTWGNCALDDSGNFTKYIGCSNTNYQCQAVRTGILSNAMSRQVCTESSQALYKEGTWFSADAFKVAELAETAQLEQSGSLSLQVLGGLTLLGMTAIGYVNHKNKVDRDDVYQALL